MPSPGCHRLGPRARTRHSDHPDAPRSRGICVSYIYLHTTTGKGASTKINQHVGLSSLAALSLLRPLRQACHLGPRLGGRGGGGSVVPLVHHLHVTVRGKQGSAGAPWCSDAVSRVDAPHGADGVRVHLVELGDAAVVHDDGGLGPLVERVVPAPHVHNVLLLRAAAHHHLHAVAENLARGLVSDGRAATERVPHTTLGSGRSCVGPQHRLRAPPSTQSPPTLLSG